MDYSFLHDQYPEVITMDQLYRICHICKRKARWLLENGIIPCEDSGKKTRRFKIKLDDAIEFLEYRDAGLLDDQMPVGIFSSVSPAEQPRTRLDNGGLRAFLLDRWMDAQICLPSLKRRPCALTAWVLLIGGSGGNS